MPEPNQNPESRGRAPVVPFVAAIVLMLLAVGARPGLAGLSTTLVGRDHRAEPTATPTRTPRPTRPSGRVPTARLDLAVVAPAARATPLPSPAPEMAAPAPPPFLSDVVQRYGMDPARRFIVVDPNAQKMIIWEPGKAVRELPVSTGDEEKGWITQAWYGLVGRYWGTFQSFGTYADEGWFLFDTPRGGSILIHGAPYTLADGVKVYKDMAALGSYPASRGCIRLDPADARWFTEWRPQGVPIAILPRNNP